MAKLQKDVSTFFDEPGIKVRVAYLHKAIIIGGITSASTTLSHVKIPHVQMTYTPMGLFVRAPMKGTGALVHSIVPLANVASVIVEE